MDLVHVLCSRGQPTSSASREVQQAHRAAQEAVLPGAGRLISPCSTASISVLPPVHVCMALHTCNGPGCVPWRGSCLLCCACDALALGPTLRRPPRESVAPLVSILPKSYHCRLGRSGRVGCTCQSTRRRRSLRASPSSSSPRRRRACVPTVPTCRHAVQLQTDAVGDNFHCCGSHALYGKAQECMSQPHVHHPL